VVVIDQIENGKSVGILTDRDVVEVVATALDPNVITAGDIMTPSPITVEEEEDVSDAVQ
jgi:CBS domain-containing protein